MPGRCWLPRPGVRGRPRRGSPDGSSSDA
jgi:hypothetical protein